MIVYIFIFIHHRSSIEKATITDKQDGEKETINELN